MVFIMLSYYCWYVGILLLSVTASNALLLPSSNTINTARRGGYQQRIISSPIHHKPKNNNRVVALNAYDRFQKDDNTFGNRNRNRGSGSREINDIDEEAEQLARDLAARRGINVNNNERRGERERLQQDSMGNRNNPNSPFGKDIGGGPPFASGPTNPSFGNNAARMSSGPIPVTQSFGRSPSSQSSSDRYDKLYEDIVNSEQGQDENLFRKRMNDIPPPSDTPRRLSEQQWLRKENREIPPDAVVRGQKQQQRNFVHNDQQQRRLQSSSRSGLDIDRSNNPPLPPRGAPPRNIPPVRRSDSANYMNDQRSGMSANYQQPQSYRQPPPPSQTYNSINRERRERLSRQPMPPNGGLPPPNIRNAYKNMAMPPPPMSPPLSEIASWNYRSQQVNQNNVYNNMPQSSWNSMGGRQWRVPSKGQGPGGYQERMPLYQQGPPMPPGPYQQGRSMGYNRRSASVPLSQLAIQPHIEPIDRDTKSSQSGQTPYGSASSSSSSSMESKPLPFANMDSSEFRQPYSSREGKEPNGAGVQQPMSQQQSFDNSFPEGQQPPPMMMQPPPMMQQPMMQQPPPPMQQQQQPSSSMQQQPSPSMQQQQPGGRKSFQPPNFRDVPQSDFRQPSQFEEQQTFGDKPAPSFPGSPSSQGNGPPPNFDQQQSPFDDDMMFGPPFGVPPMMFPPMGGPPPGVNEKRSQSVFSGEDGVKVPKDPILEKQKRQQQRKSTGSVPQTNQSLKGKEEIKIPKDPFMERKKKKAKSPLKQQQQQQQVQKQPTDPFVERQKQQERLLEMGLPPPQPIPIQQQNNPQKGEERIPKEPRERRPNEPQQRRPYEPQLGSRNSYAPQRKSSIPESGVNTPRDPRQPPGSNFDRPSFGGKTSFGSDGGDDMTYEEYLQYYNLNK